MVDPSPLARHIAARLDIATAALADKAGDRSLCEFGRHGRAPPSLKRWEGRMAALMQARRALKADDPRAELGAALARWRRALAAHRKLHGDDSAWVEYDEGAVEELEDVLRAEA
jgi:hypothetical protein